MWKIFICLYLTLSKCTCLNILVIVSMPLTSHDTSIRPLIYELTGKGHNVTVVTNFPDINPPVNLRFVDLGRDDDLSKRIDMQTFEKKGIFRSRITNFYNFLMPLVQETDCDTLLNNINMKNHYKQRIKYDVVLVELFMSDCGLAYSAMFYDAPIIGISTQVLLPWFYQRLGLPNDIASDAFYFSHLGENFYLFDKAQSLIENFLLNTVSLWYKNKVIYDVFRRHHPDKIFDIERLAGDRIKMMFVYQHSSLIGARLLTPQVIDVGGIHIGKVKSVPLDIEKFLENATHGAVYVSFGSNLKFNSMSKNKLEQFLTAFNNTPYKVLWKWENGSLPTEYKNIYTNSWFSQLDVLCHPKVKAFVSHGGMLSISEAAHCATPVLVIPFYGDQFSNAAAVRSVGLGKTLFIDRINAQNLEKTVRELMSDEMQQNAQRVSRQWHDRPMSAMDSAIYWTEYVARHRSGPPSLPSKNNSWFQSLLIDVYICIFVIFALIGLFFYAIFKLIKFILFKLCNIIFGNKAKKE